MDWIDPLISFFRLSVSQSVCLLTDRLSNDYVNNSLPIFTTFCMRLRNMSLRRLLFVRETGSSLRILEVCGFRFWQFSGCRDHIFQQISTKSHTQIKFSNADFVFNGRDVQIPNLTSINYYVHNSLPIFTKFCMRLRNVVASSPIVCERNRK